VEADMDYPDKTGQHAAVKADKDSHEGIDLDRCARLVADGDLPFPTDLCEDAAERLAGEISRLRRARLVKHIARAMADDIVRSRGQI